MNHIHAYYTRLAVHAECTANRAPTHANAVEWYAMANTYRRLAAQVQS